MKTGLKKLFLLAVVLVIIFIIALSLRPVPIRVESASITRGPLQVTVAAEGKTRVRDRFQVAAPITGRLARISLKRGDQVERNSVIARIAPLPLAPLDQRQMAEAEARVAAAEQLQHEAEALVAHTRADCEQAQREYARAEKLVETGDIAQQEFERARNTLQACRQQLEAATFRARAALAEVDVARAALLAVQRAGQSDNATVVTVRAPVSGRVLRVLEESERVVQAGTPLLEISNRALEIVVDVLSTDAVKIRPGANVLLEGWGGEQILKAHVRMIEPSAFTKISTLGIEEQRVNVIADFIDPSDRLGDGYRIEARIVVYAADELTIAPASALFRQGAQWAVYTIRDGTAHLQLVETGHRTSSVVEIRNGLKEGEIVIVHPASEVAEGKRVTTES